MKKLYVIVIFLFFSLSTFSQVNFVKGYYIDNSNNRVECLIKNVDWNDNPSEFQYKLDDGKTIIKKDSEVKEFGFENTKYVSVDVDVDQSSDKLSMLSRQKNPEFKKQRLLLKVLVDGTNKLYHYSKNEFQRFFYSANGTAIQQLIYKRYYPSASSSSSFDNQFDMATNNLFRQQLLTSVKCSTIQQKDVEKLKYTKSDLVKYFEQVNLCSGDAPLAGDSKIKKGYFNLKASAILGQHSFAVASQFVRNDFGTETYATIGVEAEYIFPFLNNKWSVIFEPHFISFEKTEQLEENHISVEFNYVQFPIGFRHYFFISDESKIFLNASLNYSAISNTSSVDFIGINHDPYVIGPNSMTFGFGAGYNYKKFSFEIRYNSKGNPSAYTSIDYDYNNSSLILRYQFLKL